MPCRLISFDWALKRLLRSKANFDVLEHEEIKEEFSAKDLKKAREILDIMRLSDSERAAYKRHAENLHFQASMYESTYVSGKLDGIKEGQQQEKHTLARLMKQNGEPLEKIALIYAIVLG